MTESRRSDPSRFDRVQASEQEQKYLLVASTGGHLAQLVRLSQRWNMGRDSLWITFDTPQSRSLLEGQRVSYVPYVKSRGYWGVVRTLGMAASLLSRERFDMAVSTGAAIALGVVPVARVFGTPTTYIESVSRLDGPSLTGKILAFSRLSELRTQHQNWATDRWKQYPSVLSQFQSIPREDKGRNANPRIFVTLGTIRPYRFDSLVDAVLATGLADSNTTWQLGETKREQLPGTSHEHFSAPEFERLSREADIVVTHAGVGSILSLLEWGIHPVVIPRQRSRGEHVDDHQNQISRLVRELGVATVTDSADLTQSTLREAQRLQTISRVDHG